MKIKVKNMTSPQGNTVPNQFVITTGNIETFQSYNAVIGTWDALAGTITLDEYYHNYSKTTSKYRNKWLGLNSAEVEKQIKTGEIQLGNLN